MAINNTPKQRKVWQDIRPVQAKPIVAQKELVKKQKNKIRISNTLKKIKIKLPNVSKKSKIIFLSVTAVLFIIVTGYFLYNKFYNRPTVGLESKETATVTKEATPEYPTITPASKNIEEIGGWTHVSRPGSDSFYRYSDTIGDVKINVNQQALPPNLKTDTEIKIKQLALDLNANESLTVGKLTVHIKTSKEGQQYVIFSKNNLLISITSDSRISNDQWIKYINSLQ